MNHLLSKQSECADKKPAMITQAAPAWQPQEWTGGLDLVRDAGELLEMLSLAPDQVALSEQAARQFPLRVPRSFVALMEPGRADDPLLRQVLNVQAETTSVPGYGPDPVGEQGSSPVPGVLHKYRGRILLVATGACAVHCRYCFRRHFPYSDHLPRQDRLDQALTWLADHADIDEVILSGGDPLSLSDERLAGLLESLSAIPHLRRLRLHTRLPVVEPARLTPRLHRILSHCRLPVVLVLHANHGREISTGLRRGLEPLRRDGVTLLNQAVLLRQVNDSADTLADLSEQLFTGGVLPYYLHLLDPVAGAAHFHVSEQRAQALMADIRARLPGYLVPRLVRELAGEPGKTVIA
jgi:EF-P beta-lysylation protein EpmB